MQDKCKMQLNSFIKLFGDINNQDKILLNKWNTISCNSNCFEHLEFKCSHDHNYKFKPFMNYSNFNKMNIMIKSIIQVI